MLMSCQFDDWACEVAVQVETHVLNPWIRPLRCPTASPVRDAHAHPRTSSYCWMRRP